MKILGIETSCDETAASVVIDGRQILSNIVATSLKDHQKFGGIIPEIASRRQMELIYLVVGEALKRAQLKLNQIDAVAVTKFPGLMGSLLVGISFAQSLSYALKKPLIEVDHIQAHLYANFIRFKNDPNKNIPKLPAIGLVASGGHTSLYEIESFSNIKLLGQTRDDAAGEAFDKVARILDLGYPGGPIIDRLAQEGQNNSIRFSGARMENSFDFSFSGLKTAVLYFVQKEKRLTPKLKSQIAYSFQESVIDTLVDRCLKVCKQKKISTLLIGGGVAANSLLRKKLTEKAELNKIKFFMPPLTLCLDNAAMVAGLGFRSRG